MDPREAVLDGNTNRSPEIQENTPTLLDKFLTDCFDDTPLPMEALEGILQLCPDLVESLDSSRSSPLHLAVAKGCVGIFKLLVLDKPEMCNGLNQDGLSPAHLAVIKSRTEVVRQQVQESWNKVRTDQGETVLHLCVKHCQLEILKMLITSVDEVQDLASAKDVHGNTILHVAVSEKHVKIMESLLASRKVDINAENTNGYTPLDVLSRRDVQNWIIGNCIEKAGAVNGNSTPENGTNSPTPPVLSNPRSENKHNEDRIISAKRDAMMVMSSLVGAVAFQMGANPPGGVWQDYSITGSVSETAHRVGESVLASTNPETYRLLYHFNTFSFIASVTTLLLLISGLPFNKKTFMRILTIIMWISVSAMALTYTYAIDAVTPRKERNNLRRTMYVAFSVWGLAAVLLFLAHLKRNRINNANGGLNM